MQEDESQKRSSEVDVALMLLYKMQRKQRYVWVKRSGFYVEYLKIGLFSAADLGGCFGGCRTPDI